MLHRHLQQHGDLEAGLRLHLRLPSRERGRLQRPGERPPGSVPQLRRARQPAGPPAHAAHRQRAARLGRSPRPELPRRRRRRDRALSARDRRPHRRPAAGRAPLRPGPAARGHEHGRQAGHPRRVDPLRRLRLHAHGGLGRADGHPRPRCPGLRHAAPVRAGQRSRAPPPVVRRQLGVCAGATSPMASSTGQTPGGRISGILTGEGAAWQAGKRWPYVATGTG